ncbi:MarR family winged helix-turn-helix transcriptional regulator [Paenibacillus lentus]|uniref:MarR family transcriptional regulator n=1 Tax=Paenibacillus lentus TaxID=1338368 RepID=A0A3S8RYQ5_9BACL|nr:MarR family transcriptional regulator [Paenibacillus lentus]AZK48057.1 MarR family transcriptional regulator [Paenibacillus lentus]
MPDQEHTASLKLFVVLSKAYKTIMDQAIKDMKRHGLSPSEFTILEVLYNKGRIPLQQIGDKILITSGSVTYNIDKLVQKGLIRRVPCEEDRRVIHAEITTDGTEMFEQIFPDHSEFVHSRLSSLSYEEKLQAIELLKRLGKGAEVS